MPQLYQTQKQVRRETARAYKLLWTAILLFVGFILLAAIGSKLDKELETTARLLAVAAVAMGLGSFVFFVKVYRCFRF